MSQRKAHPKQVWSSASLGANNSTTTQYLTKTCRLTNNLSVNRWKIDGINSNYLNIYIGRATQVWISYSSLEKKTLLATPME